MTDDAELAGLDPFDLFDREAARLDAYFAALPGAEWSRQSRCADWSVQEVLAHLLASEDYNRACVDGEVSAFIQSLGARGATDLDSANALGVAELAGRSPQELLALWRTANAQTRRQFRQRGDGQIDTSIGEYPCRWQAFHLAAELAIHADDVFLPVTAEEAAERRAWRAKFSRFALPEAKPDVAVHHESERTRVTGGDVDVVVGDDELIEGVAGRLDESSRLDAAARALLKSV